MSGPTPVDDLSMSRSVQRAAILVPLSQPKRRRLPHSIRPYLLVAPGLSFVALFVLIPAILVVVLSVFRVDLLNFSLDYVGLENFRDGWSSDEFRQGTLNTILYTLMTVPSVIVSGLLIALGVHSLARGATIWRAIFFLPYASTLVAMAVVWRWIYFPNTGLLDSTIGGLLGVSDWLNSFDLALPAVAIVGNWHLLGFVVVIFLAGLTGVPKHLHEAARLDGAGAWSRFWHVTWPALGPATVFAIVMTTILSLRQFETIRVMTNGGPVDHTSTLTFLIWRRGVEFLDIGGAAVMTVVLLVLILVTQTGQLRSFGRRLERAGTR